MFLSSKHFRSCSHSAINQAGLISLSQCRQAGEVLLVGNFHPLTATILRMEGDEMTIRNVLFSLLVGAMVCLALASVGEASVPRAFVSINGLDTNPCSAVQPCRSFNQALTVVEAGGEIVVQDSGGYSTGFTITQSVTIDAGGFNASVLSTTATDLCTINTAPTDRVVLRGISFHGAGVGTNAINATQVGSLYIEHCSMSEFTLDGVMMAHGGSIWLTDTRMRKCFNGLVVRASFAT